MSRTFLITAMILALLSMGGVATTVAADGAIETVTLPNPDSPIIAVRLLLKTGSIHDPAGKEGLASLTGMMVGDAGTQKRSYSELIDALYPMASSIEVETDREVTVISGEVHREKLAEYTALLTEAMLEPAFSESDFSRNKEQALAYLTTTLRASNDELLGLEAIQQVIFDGHPYQHSPAGTVEALESITLEDVKKFYRDHYTQANLMLGVAGGYPEGYVESLERTLTSLPKGEPGKLTELPAPGKVEGKNFTIIDKETDSVGIHIGYALPINRTDPDYYPLMVANSYLGEHRTFHGRLMQQLRGQRGLNYGDYSYIEYWYVPPFTMNPTPNVPRRQQYFSVWVRPVVPETAHFALRDALFEVDRLANRGLTQEEFELARDFLVNYSKLWGQTLPNRLAWHMDSRYYGMPYYIDEIDKRLEKLTLEEVNAAAKKYIRTDDYHAVLVTNNAAEVKAYLEQDQPSPMKYNAAPEQQVLDADTTIEKIKVAPSDIEIVPVAKMFQQ
ncbi:MAG: pitrilysin family protein [Thermoanaerobaculia bacterium]